MTHQVITGKYIHYTLFGHQSECKANNQNQWRNNSKQWLSLYIQNSLASTLGGCGFGGFIQSFTGKGREYPQSTHYLYLVSLLSQVNEAILKLDTVWIVRKSDLHMIQIIVSFYKAIERKHGILFPKGFVQVLHNQSTLDL